MNDVQLMTRVVKHIAAFGRPGQRLLDVVYGPRGKFLRTQVAAMILDRKVTGSDKAAQYGNLRSMLWQLAGVEEGCIAAKESDFEIKARTLIGA